MKHSLALEGLRNCQTIWSINSSLYWREYNKFISIKLKMSQILIIMTLDID